MIFYCFIYEPNKYIIIARNGKRAGSRKQLENCWHGVLVAFLVVDQMPDKKQGVGEMAKS